MEGRGGTSCIRIPFERSTLPTSSKIELFQIGGLHALLQPLAAHRSRIVGADQADVALLVDLSLESDAPVARVGDQAAELLDLERVAVAHRRREHAGALVGLRPRDR